MAFIRDFLSIRGSLAWPDLIADLDRTGRVAEVEVRRRPTIALKKPTLISLR